MRESIVKSVDKGFLIDVKLDDAIDGK